MKSIARALLATLVLAAVVIVLRHRPARMAAPPPPVTTPAGPPAAPSVATADTREVAAREEPLPQVEAPSAPAIEPQQQLELLRTIFRNYGQRFRGNPVGNNAEITAALRGGNPGGADFLDAAAGAVNARGELTDAWGTPYFFHQLSAFEMEVRSAGPDRRLYTGDDLVIR